MKEFRFRLIIIVGAIALAIYLLWPTYVDYQYGKEIEETLKTKKEEITSSQPDLTNTEVEKMLEVVEDSLLADNPDISKTREKRIKLGLDLQGGMRVVLEVNTGKLIEKLAKNPDEVFKSLLAEAEEEATLSDEAVVDIIALKFQEKGIRLSRYFGTIRQDDDEILTGLKEDAEDAVTRAMEIIRNRIDQYGVSEPSIQRQGSRRIIVELPGVAREEEAKQLLQGTALLEFRLVKDREIVEPLILKLDNIISKFDEVVDSTIISSDKSDSSTIQTDSSVASIDSSNIQPTEEELKKMHPFTFAVRYSGNENTYAMYIREDERNQIKYWINLPEIQKIIPNNVEFVFGAKPIPNVIEEDKEFYNLFVVNKSPELTGGVITDAVATIDPNTSAPIVNMTMNSEGATEWARITGANVGKRIAIMLDGVAFSAPNVQNKIPGGRSQITGMADLNEAKLLEIVLKAGALPAPVDIIEERTVGPSLGQDSVNSGFSSVVIGYILVGIFMIFYYHRSGTIAAAVLTFTILFILGVLAGFNATLTLPGIAGIILTIGMAVDANVLIFERIREEMATGKTIKASIDSGFSRAYSAIIDSNITTFFTGIILYQFGTGPIQGFALTLMIGIAASLFSALVVARLIFDLMVAKGIKVTVG